MNNLLQFRRTGLGDPPPSYTSAYNPASLQLPYGYGLLPIASMGAPPVAAGVAPDGRLLTAAEIQALIDRGGAGGNPSGVGVRFTGKGIEFGDGSAIGWPMIMLAIGAIVLIQMKPVTRK